MPTKPPATALLPSAITLPILSTSIIPVANCSFSAGSKVIVPSSLVIIFPLLPLLTPTIPPALPFAFVTVTVLPKPVTFSMRPLFVPATAPAVFVPSKLPL